jgi:hypothetical protein
MSWRCCFVFHLYLQHKLQIMLKLPVLTGLIFMLKLVQAQTSAAQSYWQQHVDYTIDVTLNDTTHTLQGFITMQYTNNSPDVLDFLYIHIWPNAYRNTKTAFAREEVENRITKFQFAKDDERGYMDGLDFTVNGLQAEFTQDAEHIDYGKLKLDKALQSGETITIATPFRVKIPSSAFSRLGHNDQAYQITQWYPKPAVYDAQGWHPMPYLNQGEFYSEFGNFTVNITLPANYVVAASGNLQTESEKQFLEAKAEETRRMSTNSSDLSFPPSSPQLKTIQYKLENAHDFAWFADKRFHVLTGEVKMPYSDKKVKTIAYFTNLEADLWMQSIEYLNRSVYNYSEWVGEYEWDVCQALEGALSAGAGMEYPTITIIGESGTGFLLDDVIAHEVGHNWFFGMFGFNERIYPWLDEGINSYYEVRYLEKYYPDETLTGFLGGFPLPGNILQGITLRDATMKFNAALEKTNNSQAPGLPATEYTSLNYGMVVYMKTDYYMNYLAEFLGQNNFDRAMGAFFRTWKLKHPYPADLQAVFEQETGENLNWFFQGMINENRSLDYQITDVQAGKTSVVVRIKNNGTVAAPFPISLMAGDTIKKTDWQRGFLGTQTIYLNKNRDWNITSIKIDAEGIMPEYEKENNSIKTKGIFKTTEPLELQFLTTLLDNTDKTSIMYSPLLGGNANDGFMLGLGLYNSTFAMPTFEYVLAPMYAFGSKNIAGQGSLGLNFYPASGFASRWRISSSLFNYTYYKKIETDSAEVLTTDYFDYTKIENKLQFDIRKKYLRTSPQQSITLRNILVDEEDYLFLEDSTAKGFDMFQTINYNISAKKILYPWSADVNAVLGDGFTRISLEGNFLINYPISKQGIDIRIFAGKFLGETEGNERYYFTAGGANGLEDYLYDEIFLGRNTYESYFDNQIMMRDGFMKLPAGSSSNYLLAANLKLGIPKVPFIGLFADGVLNPDNPEGQTILYDAGVALTIIDNIFEIYYTVMNSDFLETTALSFGDRMSFVLNLHALNPFEALRKF